MQKQLHQSRCRLGCELGWVQGTVLDDGPDHYLRIGNFDGQKLSEREIMVAERARSTILQQQLPSFRETLDQVHFSCRRLLKNDKIWCIHIL